jgi:hypothetical protein
MNTAFGRRNTILRCLMASGVALSAGLACSQASAAPVVTGIQLMDQNAGTLDVFGVNNLQTTMTFDKTFESNATPMVIRLTVGHAAVGGGPFTVTENIKNETGVEWSDYHISLQNAPNGSVFANFENSTLGGFTLDPAPGSSTTALNFTGKLANGSTGSANFMLSLNDPGAGNSYTLNLVQSPSTQPVPVPMAGWLFGSGLLALRGRMRRKNG